MTGPYATDQWLVMRDRSGHHRAVQPVCDLTATQKALSGDVVVDRGADYYWACRKADELNEIAEVMAS